MAHIKSHAYWERVKIIDKSFLVLENLLAFRDSASLGSTPDLVSLNLQVGGLGISVSKIPQMILMFAWL